MEEDTKTCTKCGQDKPRAEFHRRTKSPDGLKPCCKKCDAARRKAHYEANRETILAKQSAAYYANPEPKKEASRRSWQQQMARDPVGAREKGRLKAAALREAHPERFREAARRWREANPEKAREVGRASHRKRRQWEKPHVKEYKRKWRADNPELKAAAQVRYRARKKTPKVLRFTPVQGGMHCLANIRPICRSCNATKNATWPVSTSTRFLAAA